MMRFRWVVAGGKDLPFDPGAIQEIYRLTGGIARDICKLANEALLRGRPLPNRSVFFAAYPASWSEIQNPQSEILNLKLHPRSLGT
jgi:hypothetical protein